jgi:hypothetical protein
LILSNGASAKDFFEAAAKAALWAPAATLASICDVVLITLELSTFNYLQWRDMFSDTVEKVCPRTSSI